jgi:hypothetical protein
VLATKQSLGWFLFLCVLCFYFLSGCNSKKEDKVDDKLGFLWKKELNASDVPDFNVKGFLNEQQVTFEYINFERWHGSNDNVLSFSLSKPHQPCGYIENFSGFRVISKGNSMKQGEFSKQNFSSAADSYQAAYFSSSADGRAQWNCILIIENISEKKITGRIALCFNDEKKSWLAGKFDAQVCNN